MERRKKEIRELTKNLALISQSVQQFYDGIQFLYLPEIAIELIVNYNLWNKYGMKTMKETELKIAKTWSVNVPRSIVCRFNNRMAWLDSSRERVQAWHN